MEVLLGVFAAFGLSASAGLNAYIPLLAIALLAKFTNLLNLNPPWDTLTDGWIIGLLVVLSLIEFLADKFPAVNHVNDIIQTVIRPVAGAIAFAASAKVLTDVSPVLSLASGLIIAGSVHTVKSAAVRPAVTATTGGAGNIPVSIAEDILATVVSLVSIVLPVLAAIMLVVAAILILYFFWKRTNRRQPYRPR